MKRFELLMGIDPGASGGIALIDRAGTLTEAIPMPKTVKDIADFIEGWQLDIAFALLESVHSFPKQGVSSSFNFGMNFGMLKMALVHVPHEEIQPSVWQREFGL